MAGFVSVIHHREPSQEGSVNIGGRPLDAFFQVLKYAKYNTPVLAADEHFHPMEDCQAYDCIRYITLARYADTTVTELVRVLHDILDPAHPFWQDNSRFFPSRGISLKRIVRQRGARSRPWCIETPWRRWRI